MIQSQPSALLPSLFEQVDDERCLSVLHIGSALPETVHFFSRYRCKLHFIDLFGDLPHLGELVNIPADTQFDLCLFWDLFNFLDRTAIAALPGALRPHLHSNSLAHGFAVHNLKTPQSGVVYGIREPDRITLRPRSAKLPGYNPCNQGQLEKSLDCFRVIRSVLLAQGRVELLFGTRPQA